MAQEVPNCIVCGKPCERGDDSARTTYGKISTNGKHKDQEEFGVMHRSCHNRATMTPRATRDELQRQSRASSTSR